MPDGDGDPEWDYGKESEPNAGGDSHEDEFDEEYQEQQPKGDPNAPDNMAWDRQYGGAIDEWEENERQAELGTVGDPSGVDYTYVEPTVIATVQGPAFNTAFDEANLPFHERPIKDMQDPPYNIPDLVEEQVDEQSGAVAPVPVGGEELPDGNANGIPGGYGDGPDLDANGVPDEIGINPDNRQPGYDDPGEAAIVDPADEVALNPQPLPPRPDEYVMHEAVIVDPGSEVGLNPLPPDPFDSTLADDAEITDQSYSDLSPAETAVPMPGPNASLGFA